MAWQNAATLWNAEPAFTASERRSWKLASILMMLSGFLPEKEDMALFTRAIIARLVHRI